MTKHDNVSLGGIMKATEYFKKMGWNFSNIRLEELEHNKCFDEFYNELKRLVESHELIKKDFESVEMAEYEYMISASHDEPYWIRVRQAIADVEACQ